MEILKLYILTILTVVLFSCGDVNNQPSLPSGVIFADAGGSPSANGSRENPMLLNDAIFVRFQRFIADLLVAELEFNRGKVSNDKVSFVVGGIFAVLQHYNFNKIDVSRSSLCDRLNFFADRILSK